MALQYRVILEQTLYFLQLRQQAADMEERIKQLAELAVVAARPAGVVVDLTLAVLVIPLQLHPVKVTMVVGLTALNILAEAVVVPVLQAVPVGHLLEIMAERVEQELHLP
jgi:hypothetical protein